MERGNSCTQTFNASHNSCCSTCILVYVITKKTDCRYYLFFRSFDKPLNADYFSTLQHRLHTLYVTQRLVFALVTIQSSWKAKYFFCFQKAFSPLGWQRCRVFEIGNKVVRKMVTAVKARLMRPRYLTYQVRQTLFSADDWVMEHMV